jgi:signal transduction histidine kinase
MAVGERRGVEAVRRRILSSEEQLALLRMRLHDSTLQTLEFIANMGAMRGADMDRLVRLAAREATELRHMLEGLTREAPVTLTTAISEVVTAATAYGDERIALAVGVTDDSVESFTALELAAAVREALTNARKHAAASAITVYVEEHGGGALVTVKDDGRGSDLATLQPRLGIGVSMRSRMARLGGDVEFQSEPGKGFLVRLTLHPPAPAVQAPLTSARERRRHDGRQHAQRSAVA